MRNKSYKKICKNCKGRNIIKYGKFRGKQRYQCKDCKHTFENNRRQKITDKQIFKDYVFGKQTYNQLKEKYGISIKTIQKKIDNYILSDVKLLPREIVLLIDTTYFGKNLGVMAFKDYESKKILKIEILERETYYDYKKGVEELIKEGWTIKAIVCDGKRGLLGGFGEIPTQMCNFHQSKIIQKYITKKPKLEANIELKGVVNLLTRTDKETFEYELNKWYEKYESFLKERRVDENGKWHYIHRRTRSAYFSLKNNLKYLFIWYDYIGIIDIPNTTNGLEGFFSHIKAKVSLHRGLKKERKIKLILALFYKKI